MRRQERKGVPLTDDLIRGKARAFAATTAQPENHVAPSASWIEKFKLKNNLMGARSRKGSLAPDDVESASAAASASQTPSGTSPISPAPAESMSPVDLHSAQSHESLKNESPDSYLDFGSRQPIHSQSTTSLNSNFTDTAPSSFSPGPLSPTSPFFTPDSATAPNPFVPAATARPILAALAASGNSQRPRSQTFPLLDQYMFSGSSSEALTPKFATSHGLDSPMEEPADAALSMDDVAGSATVARNVPTSDVSQPQTVSPAETMGPPPLPASLAVRDHRRRSCTPAAAASTSPEEARRALQVVLHFFEQQPNGFLDLQESVTLGKLMEKLRLPA